MYKYIYMLIQRSYTFIPTVITRLRAYLLTLNARALVTHPPSATVATVKWCAFFHVLHFFLRTAAKMRSPAALSYSRIYTRNARRYSYFALCCHLNIICTYECKLKQ